MTTPRRVLLLGVGGFGFNWVGLLANRNDCQVVGIVDIQSDAIRRACPKLGLDDSRVYGDLDRALVEARPELVIDSTPPKFRVQWARRVFRYGAHLIVAKPFAETLRDAAEMVDLAQKCGCLLAVNQQQRFCTVAQTLAEYVRSGRIGRHVCTYFTFFERRAWSDRLVEVPSPLFVESSIHHFDLFHAVLGQEIKAVNAIGWTPPDIPAVGYTAGAAWLQLADGSRILYEASRSARTDLDGAYRTSWHGPWVIEGTEGVLRGSDREGVFLNGACVLSLEDMRNPSNPTTMNQMNAAFFDAFMRAWSDGAPSFDLSGEKNLRTLAVACAAEMSVRSGKWVDVDDLLSDSMKRLRL